MKVPELLKRLALGELSNLSMGNSGLIDMGKIPKIIMYTNEALLRLHTKFVLKEKALIIEMREDITNYQLIKRFAYTNYDPENPPSAWNMPYIMDLANEPFEEDVIKVLSVYDYDGEKLPINDTQDIKSVFCPQAKVLQVPYPLHRRLLSVEYQASHAAIPDTDYEEVDVDVPSCLESAMQAYIASKVFMHMNTQENTAKGQEHFMLFEMHCQSVIDMDLVSTTSNTTNSRFEKNGWI